MLHFLVRDSRLFDIFHQLIVKGLRLLMIGFYWVLHCRRWRGLNPCAYNMQPQHSGLYHLLSYCIVQMNLKLIQLELNNRNQVRSWSQPPEMRQSLNLFCKSQNKTFVVLFVYTDEFVSCKHSDLNKIIVANLRRNLMPSFRVLDQSWVVAHRQSHIWPILRNGFLVLNTNIMVCDRFSVSIISKLLEQLLCIG